MLLTMAGPRWSFVVILCGILCTITPAPLDKSVVKSWSHKVEEYLLQLSEEGLKTQELQKHYDEAIYRVESKKGSETVNSVKARLGNYFVKKEEAARVRNIKTKIIQLMKNKCALNYKISEIFSDLLELLETIIVVLYC